MRCGRAGVDALKAAGGIAVRFEDGMASNNSEALWSARVRRSIRRLSRYLPLRCEGKTSL